MTTDKHEAIVAAGGRWAERDPRVRALLLKGSLARGDADERSDVDFVVVAQPGRLEALWSDRRAIAEGLGGWLGGFDEVAWQAPHTFIGFCDGPVKVDFFFQEGEPAADPWLRDGFRALVDPDGARRRAPRARWRPEPPLAGSRRLRRPRLGLAVGGAPQVAPARPRVARVHRARQVRGDHAAHRVRRAGAGAVAGRDAHRGAIARRGPRAAARRVAGRPEEAELRRALGTALDGYLAVRRRLAESAACRSPPTSPPRSWP